MTDIPGNSDKERVEGPEERKIEKVVTGNSSRKKKGIKEKISENIFGDNLRTAWDHIVYEILIPAAKDAMSDIVRNSVDILIYGESRPVVGRGNRGRERSSIVDYTAPSRGRGSRDAGRRSVRSNYDVEDVIVDSRREANLVIEELVTVLENYNEVSVAEYYRVAGVEWDYPDNAWGWYNLSEVRITQMRDGWYIHMPRPIALER